MVTKISAKGFINEKESFQLHFFPFPTLPPNPFGIMF